MGPPASAGVAVVPTIPMEERITSKSAKNLRLVVISSPGVSGLTNGDDIGRPLLAYAPRVGAAPAQVSASAGQTVRDHPCAAGSARVRTAWTEAATAAAAASEGQSAEDCWGRNSLRVPCHLQISIVEERTRSINDTHNVSQYTLQTHHKS